MMTVKADLMSGSSMVEQSAVNRPVGSSNLPPAAKGLMVQ